MLGVAVSDERLVQARTTEEQIGRQRAAKRRAKTVPDDPWPDSDENFAYIAGYTSGGFPYGVRWDELEQSPEQLEGERTTIVSKPRLRSSTLVQA